MTRAVYPGSFDPVTLGHMDIIRRASRVVDELVIGVLINRDKNPLFTVEERVEMLQESVKELKNVSVKTFDGRTVDFARANQAQIIIRGLRAVTDFAHEMQMAQTNRILDPTIDTMFFTTSLRYAYLSSTIVKEVAHYDNTDISKFVNPIKEKVVEALSLKANDFVALSAGALGAAQKTAGVLVKTLGAAVPGHMDKEQYAFCWIVDFPMYEIGDESGELEFCHNPFSMPSGGLDVLLKAEKGEIDPLSITADQYDLVCNGVELSSGAVRNHDPEIMIKAFELVRLGEDDVKAKFPAMYNAFCYGAPPHAGIAPGVDRMVMLLAGEDSIREIIPFPMNKNAQDIMMGAPSEVTQKQLDELHIAVTAHEEE